MCAADELYACNTSLVGSIGVVGNSFGVVDAMKRLGVERRLAHAGTRSPRHAFLPSRRSTSWELFKRPSF